MNVEQAKIEIARRAFQAGYAFDFAEIIDGPLEGKTAVFLRSVRAVRIVEDESGARRLEEYNYPIVWIELPSPGPYTAAIDGLSVKFTTPAPQVCMLHPEFAILLD